MKKKLALLAAILALIAILAVAFTACSGPQLTALETLQQQYNEIALAKTIEQTITIKSGEMTQFESIKTYAKTDDGYDVTGYENRLNNADAEEMFTKTDISTKVQKAVNVTPTLKLDEQYFETGYRLTETGLTAQIRPENIKDVFGISDELKAPTDDLTLELSVSGGHVTSARISYLSKGSNVTISLTMTY